jgi:signal transduction histidine kinase
VAISLAGAVIGISAEWAFSRTGVGVPDLVRDALVGWSFIGAGLVAWARQPGNRTGRLMVAVGFAWFLGNFEATGVPIFFSISSWLSGLNLAVLAHLVLSFPSGRLATRAARLATAASYGLVGVVGLAHTFTYDPSVTHSADYLCGPRCSQNALLLVRSPTLFTVIDLVYHGLAIVLGLVMLVLILERWRSASDPLRRVLTPVWASTFLLVVSIFIYGALTLGGQPSPFTLEALVWVSDIGQLAIPLAFLFGLLRMQLARGAVGELVIELGAGPPPSQLRDALARTLGDPGLELLFWVPESDGYVTPRGRPAALPGPESGRIVTLVEQRGRPLASIVHDPALADDRRLVDAVRAAARLGLENERLHAELRARLEEVRASRIRILEAGQAERQRIERNLHDGAQQRLISVALTLRTLVAQLQGGPDGEGEVRETVEIAMQELRQALADLRELARGIHPAVLVQQGLAAAATSLAEGAPLPVVVRIPDSRYPELVESTAYYVVCEAVANAARHSGATWVEVTAAECDGCLVVEVRDDGGGGADPRQGTGLQGLTDRASALGGRLEVESTDRGTRVRAELPLCE